MTKKQYTFRIDSTATVQAESREEAKKELKQMIEHWKYALNKKAIILDEIVIGWNILEVKDEEHQKGK